MKKEDMEEVDLKLSLINAILAARPLTVAMGFFLQGLIGMSASALLSAPDLQSVSTIDDVLQALHLADPLWQAFVHQVGDPGPHIRILAALPRTVVIQGCVQATLASGDMLSAIQATHVGLVWRTCRKVAHLWAGLPSDPNDKVKEQIQTSATCTVTQVKERVLKMANVVDQADDSELLLASRLEIDRWANCYVAVTGAPPLEEEEPNEAQLSALNRRVYVLKQPPYADFGVLAAICKEDSKGSEGQGIHAGWGWHLCAEGDAGATEYVAVVVIVEGVQGGPHHAGRGVAGGTTIV